MCIAFPKAADGNEKDEPAWKSTLLLLPRLLSFVWLVLKMLAGGMKNRVLEARN
ncbi:hypothetical protein [Thiolapillus sp.]